MNMKKGITGALAFAMTIGVTATSLASSPNDEAPKVGTNVKQISLVKENQSKFDTAHKKILAKFVEFGWLDASTAAEMQERAGRRIGHRSAGLQKPAFIGENGRQEAAPMPVRIRERLQNATDEQKAEIASLFGQLEELRAQRSGKRKDCDHPMLDRFKTMKIRVEKGAEGVK